MADDLSPAGGGLKSSVAWLELGNYTSNPTDTDSQRRGIAVVANSLKLWNGSAWAAVSGGSGISTWDELYDTDQTLAIDSTTLTFNLTHATNNGVTFSASGAAAGAVVAFNNSGSGNDVTGTSSTWSVNKTGQAVFARVDLGDDQPIRLGATNDVTIQWVNASSYAQITGAIDFTAAITTGASSTITMTGTADTNVLTVTAGDILISNGKIAITNDDTDAILTMTANSVTTGNAILLTANGVTSGTMLALVTTDAGFSTGYYIRCNDGSDVFTVGDEGATVIAGAGGTDEFTITAGDAVLSDGSLTITDADNASTVSVTNNTATTAAIVAISGSGVLTGAGAALTVTADGATTAGASAGQGVATVSADGLTTGTALDVTSTSIVLTTGRLADFSHVSGNITGTLDKTAQLFNVEATRTVTTGTVADDYDMGSFVRTSVINGAGSFSATGSVLYVENAVTNTSGTVSDTVVGIELVMDSLGTGAGVKITHNAVSAIAIDIVGTATTTGKGIDLSDLNALTSGIGLHLASSATAITGAGRLLYSNHTGTTGTSAILNEFASAATDETVVVKITASAALALGNALDISVASMTTGTALDIGNADALTTGSIANLVSNSSDATARNLVFVHNDHASAAGAVPLALRNDAATSTNYYKMITLGNGSNTVTIWQGSGTTANGNLSGTAGDILLNGGTNKPEYCTGTTNWTALV